MINRTTGGLIPAALVPVPVGLPIGLGGPGGVGNQGFIEVVLVVAAILVWIYSFYKKVPT